MPAPKLLRLRALLAAVALLGACAALVPAAARTYAATAKELRRVARSLSATTLEQRRRAAYGDCGNLGYGYLTEVLRAYPDERSRPLVKWPDFSRKVHLVLPSARPNVDPRVLVGIGLDDRSFAYRAIAAASPRGERREGDAAVTRWAFLTTIDWDLLTGFAVELGGAPAAPAAYEIAVLESERTPRVMGRWTAVAAAGQDRLVLPLEPPVNGFSHGRGSTEFLVDIRTPADAPRPARVLPLGANVDGRGYVVVHRRQGCFTAVRSDLLSLAQADPSSPWARFVEALRHGG